MAFDDFTKMHVWQLAFQLLIKIYKITKKFLSEEKFGLVSDMRIAANSIFTKINKELWNQRTEILLPHLSPGT